jgi:hypothetical protein
MIGWPSNPPQPRWKEGGKREDEETKGSNKMDSEEDEMR